MTEMPKSLSGSRYKGAPVATPEPRSFNDLKLFYANLLAQFEHLEEMQSHPSLSEPNSEKKQDEGAPVATPERPLFSDDQFTVFLIYANWLEQMRSHSSLSPANIGKINEVITHARTLRERANETSSNLAATLPKNEQTVILYRSLESSIHELAKKLGPAAQLRLRYSKLLALNEFHEDTVKKVKAATFNSEELKQLMTAIPETYHRLKDIMSRACTFTNTARCLEDPTTAQSILDEMSRVHQELMREFMRMKLEMTPFKVLEFQLKKLAELCNDVIRTDKFSERINSCIEGINTQETDGRYDAVCASEKLISEVWEQWRVAARKDLHVLMGGAQFAVSYSEGSVQALGLTLNSEQEERIRSIMRLLIKIKEVFSQIKKNHEDLTSPKYEDAVHQATAALAPGITDLALKLVNPPRTKNS